MGLDEKDLVRRFQRGEPGSFDTLYDQYGDRLFRFCYRLCGRRDDAEDLTQEVFLAAWQGLESFEGRSTIATWLYRIALYRRRRVQWDQVSPDDETFQLTDSNDTAETGLNRIALNRAINDLPVGLREAFLLVKAEGLKYREAAEVLNIPQGTVQYRVSIAVARLRTALSEAEAKETALHA